ncbi:MAG: NifB/NifX family molybdenum-iron cluster-binding protein [Candidatus Nanopelagicales bacterium]
MIVAVAVEPTGMVGHSWGKAETVAVATVESGAVTGWQEFAVGWDVSHDAGSHGGHHARVVTLLREHAVQAVVVDHVGDGMRRMLGAMGLALHEGVTGDARLAAVAAAAGAAPARSTEAD